MHHNEDGLQLFLPGQECKPTARLVLYTPPEGRTPETLLVFIHFEEPPESSPAGFGSSLHLPASESLRLLDLGTKV